MLTLLLLMLQCRGRTRLLLAILRRQPCCSTKTIELPVDQAVGVRCHVTSTEPVQCRKVVCREFSRGSTGGRR